MKNYHFLQKLSLSAAFLLGFNIALAGDNKLPVCPSVDELKTLTFLGAFPYGFDNHTKSMNFISALGKTYYEDFKDKDFGLIVYPLAAGAGEDPETNVTGLVEKLQLETPSPLTYHLAKDIMQDICVYTLPGNESVVALGVYFEEDYGDPDLKKSHNKFNHTLRIKKLMKQLTSQ